MSAHLENQFISKISLQLKLVRHSNFSARNDRTKCVRREHRPRLTILIAAVLPDGGRARHII